MQSSFNDTARRLKTLVKGAGPSGLAAAVALAQEGFEVTVAEKRAYRPPGQGRKNMVALRPEALRQLELLDALEDARQKGTLTPITQAATYNEWNDSTFTWPLDTQPRYGASDDYTPPAKIDDQVPSSFINLGHLEDHLSQAAERLGVQIRYSSTFDLRPIDDGSGRYAPVWSTVSTRDGEDSRNGLDDDNGTSGNGEVALPSQLSYDLVVCASGKGDRSLEKALGFARRIGVRLEEANLPAPGCRALRLGSEREVETQRYLVFGVSSGTPAGTLNHEVRKTGTGRPEQPVVEIKMQHAAASHYILQVPRGFREDDDDAEGLAGETAERRAGQRPLDRYVTERVNAHEGSSFADAASLPLVWGDPLVPVRVETCTAPQYAFGANVVLVGDAGMSCSPTSGLGADVGLTHDGHAVRRLARDLLSAAEQADWRRDAGMYASGPWQDALDRFNRSKAEGAIMWSRGSNHFYVSKEKADQIVTAVREFEASS